MSPPETVIAQVLRTSGPLTLNFSSKHEEMFGPVSNEPGVGSGDVMEKKLASQSLPTFWYSIERAALIMDRSPNAVRKLCSSGKLKGSQSRDGKWSVEYQEVLRFMNGEQPQKAT